MKIVVFHDKRRKHLRERSSTFHCSNSFFINLMGRLAELTLSNAFIASQPKSEHKVQCKEVLHFKCRRASYGSIAIFVWIAFYLDLPVD